MDNVERAISAYIKIRDDLDAKRKAFKEVESAAKAKLDEISGYIGKHIGSAESVKTAHGTAFRAKKDFTAVEDWESAIKFIVDTDNVQMLNKSVSKAAVKEYMAEHSGATPPGIKYSSLIEIQVRRPTK